MAEQAWLLRDGEVLASLEVASTFLARLRGLLGRDSLDGAMLVTRARSVHTLGMRFAIDVAHLDRDLVVLRSGTMRRWRLGRPVLRARCVLEAPAGAFASWGLRAGDRLEIKGLG
jgi:uncharacterized membrane protein (UPF0127 family)